MTIILPSNAVIVLSPMALRPVFALTQNFRSPKSKPTVLIDANRASFWGTFKIPTR